MYNSNFDKRKIKIRFIVLDFGALQSHQCLPKVTYSLVEQVIHEPLQTV